MTTHVIRYCVRTCDSIAVLSTNADLGTECVFRKSDVKLKGKGKGWEVIISYSFRSNITSGYAKGTETANIESIVEELRACATPVSHPLLLPVILLTRALSADNDKAQKDAREDIRKLEIALAGRYTDNPRAEGYRPHASLNLDSIQKTLVNTRSQILWKRPQTWQNSVTRAHEMCNTFWDKLDPERKTPEMKKMHREITTRFDFLSARLEGLEHYTHVSLQRLDILREEVR